MSRREILVTRYGEMTDMIACYAIYNGAKIKKSKKKLSLLETMEVT